jgi:hypothetical protein
MSEDNYECFNVLIAPEIRAHLILVDSYEQSKWMQQKYMEIFGKLV